MQWNRFDLFICLSFSVCVRCNRWIAVIGGWANQRIIVRRKQGDNVLREVRRVDILASDKWIAFLLQITTRTIDIFMLDFVNFL